MCHSNCTVSHTTCVCLHLIHANKRNGIVFNFMLLHHIFHYRLLQSKYELLENQEYFKNVVSSLLRANLYEQAGELYEKNNETEKAFNCYRKGKAFSKAIELARYVSPSGNLTFFKCNL